ncbi:SPRY domain-containing protein [Azospirillum sp.]|uniref:SPRY domain-containing protein n=1 Tax=Azospirillum sp. TaxID=34012 RepID=UPI003D751408
MADFIRRRSGLAVPTEYGDGYRPRSDCFLDPLFFGMMAAIGGALDPSWNPADCAAGITLSGGNLVASDGASSARSVRGQPALPSRKLYWEIALSSPGAWNIGVATASMPLTIAPGQDVNSWGLASNGYAYYNNSGVPVVAVPGANDVIRVAVDVPNGKIWYGLNGTWAGDPSAGTSPANTGLSGTLYACLGYQTSGGYTTARFLSSSWGYAAPTGFTAIS